MEKYDVKLYTDRSKHGGTIYFNGKFFIPGGTLLGAHHGCVIPTHKLPEKYQSDATLLDLIFFGDSASLVFIKRDNDPIDKVNAVNFPHSCEGVLKEYTLNEHEEDRDQHVQCLGAKLFDRLHTPLDCLRTQPEKNWHTAADFLSVVYANDCVPPLSAIEQDKKGGKHIVPQVVEFPVMPMEFSKRPGGTIAVPCDCNKPKECKRRVYLMVNTHSNPEYKRLPNQFQQLYQQYSPSTTIYDNILSKESVDYIDREKQKLNLSGRSYQDTLTEKCGNPPLEVIYSMDPSWVFKIDKFGPGIEEVESVEYDSPEEVPKMRRNKRGGKRPLSDVESDDEMDSPAVKRAKLDTVVEAIEPVAKPKVVRRIIPTLGKLEAVVEAAEPVAEPKPAEVRAPEVRGQCGICGKDVTTAHAGRVKDPVCNVYFHKECYQQGDGAGGS